MRKSVADECAETRVVKAILHSNYSDFTEVLRQLIELAPDGFNAPECGAIMAAYRAAHSNGGNISAYLDGDHALTLELFQTSKEAEPLSNIVGDAKKILNRAAKQRITEALAAAEQGPSQAFSILQGLQKIQCTNGHGRAKLTIRSPDEILAMPSDERDNILGDGLLEKGGILTILGPGGIGKSRYLLQLAASTIAGDNFASIETHGRELRWLNLQLENGNRRLQSDLQPLRRAFPEHWQAINERLRIHTLETDRDGWLSLEAEQNLTAIADAIEEHKPDIVSFDPLNQIAIGDPNKDADMAATCQTLTRLCRKGNPKRAIVVLHHALTGRAGASKAIGMERAGYGRNSKVLQAWTRGQINLAPISNDNNDLLAVVCGKCSNGKEFAPFALRLNLDTMLYEAAPDVDMEAWRADLDGGKSDRPFMPPDKVRELCQVSGMDKAELAKAIIKDCGCVRGSAYRFIDRAEKAKKIGLNRSSELYFRK